jgi:hypothetical protein
LFIFVSHFDLFLIFKIIIWHKYKVQSKFKINVLNLGLFEKTAQKKSTSTNQSVSVKSASIMSDGSKTKVKNKR